MRHEATFNTHPNVVTVDDGLGAFDKNGNSVTIDEDKVSQEVEKLQSAEPMRLLRLERNRLLQETDYLALKDVFMTTDEELYRQQLRDITKGAKPKLDDHGNLTNITWPVRPK